jgi:hypothetical protein
MGIQIEDINTLINKDCKNAIARALSYKNIGFEKTQGRSHSREIYWLNGDNVSRASTANTTYHVVPFLPLDDIGITYWLAVGMQFDFFEGSRIFHDASIFIFEGTYSDEKKIPILRAEWGISEDGLHAQPHWHVYPSYINRVIVPFITSSKEEATEFVPEQVVKDTTYDDIEEKDVTKFHFAMGSLWHLNGQGAHVIEASEDGLVKWIGGCLEYIKVQLHYMVGS